MTQRGDSRDPKQQLRIGSAAGGQMSGVDGLLLKLGVGVVRERVRCLF